jgi:chaperone BCS1
MESVFIKGALKNDLANDIDNFLKGKDFYVSHGIPFKRGFLLYGPPGCGKTSLVGALAGKFNLSVCLLQIGMMWVVCFAPCNANLFFHSRPQECYG